MLTAPHRLAIMLEAIRAIDGETILLPVPRPLDPPLDRRARQDDARAVRRSTTAETSRIQLCRGVPRASISSRDSGSIGSQKCSVSCRSLTSVGSWRC